jgi:hypothetical protein
MDGKGAWRDNVFVERVWRSVKYEEVVCYERDGSRLEQLRCFTKDEGGPLGVGLREKASVCHERRCEPAVLYQRWESASRNRLAGADIKPPSAAASKRCGRERLGKRRSDRTSGTY